jgi:amino acid adenylation domain-containing protein
MLVQDFLQQSAVRTPDKVALVCDGQRLTYAEIDAQANRLAHALRANGVQRGDRVGLYLNNSVELVVAIFATLKAGGVFVIINHTTKFDKLSYILNNCRATALFASIRQQQVVKDVMAGTPSLQFGVLCGKGSVVPADNLLTFDDFLTGYPGDRPTCVNIDVDLACLIYTSGSTGDPKGVMSAHRNVVAAASSIIEYLRNVPDDIVINALPLSFDYGLYQLLMVFKFGGRLVLEKSFAYPAPILQKMTEERVTGFPGVPTMYAILLQMDLSAYDLSALRYVTNTGAALPPAHIKKIREMFPRIQVYSMYGVTETKRTLYLPPEEIDRRPGSVGIAIPNTEVWIEDEAGSRLGPGEIGELVARGSHVMCGYWENPEATARSFRPGPFPGEQVFYTGDLFRMDEDGFLYFVGRKDDVFKCRGQKVAPKEVENVLYGISGVVEAAIIGVPDPVLGHAPKAFLVLDGVELSETDVMRHCRAHLEDHMLPKHVEFRDELPKTTSGKIKKTDLR